MGNHIRESTRVTILAVPINSTAPNYSVRLTWSGLTRYSASTLLPNDPPPFTIPLEPGFNNPRAMVTPHTLNDFQLPDSTWMWVSRSWLVQMGDNGSSHDGFEYNWCFRQKGSVDFSMNST